MIKTARLTLRPIMSTDNDALFVLFNDPEVMRFSDDGKPQDESWTNEWVDKAVADYQKSGYGVMMVVQNETDTVLGYCGLFNYDEIDGQPEIEIGYRLIRSAWGRGYATEAVIGLLGYAHSTLNLSRIVAMIDPANIASKKVAEKADMKYEKDIMMPAYTHPDLLYVSS